jgi:hypothetical protein
MAEMTPAELAGAIQALELWGGSHYDSIQEALDKYRAQLAAQPPAVDRERRLREALEAAEKYVPTMIIEAVAVTGSDKPEYEERPHPVKAIVTAALADQPPPDPREAALEKAEADLDNVLVCGDMACICKACRRDVNSVRAAIRAARGKA